MGVAFADATLGVEASTELTVGGTGQGAVEGLDFGEHPMSAFVERWEKGWRGPRLSVMVLVVRCWCLWSGAGAAGG